MVSIAFHPEPDDSRSCDYITSVNSADWRGEPIPFNISEHCGEPSVLFLQIICSYGGSERRHYCRKHASIEMAEWRDYFLRSEAEIQALAEALVPGDKEGQSFARILIGL